MCMPEKRGVSLEAKRLKIPSKINARNYRKDCKTISHKSFKNHRDDDNVYNTLLILETKEI